MSYIIPIGNGSFMSAKNGWFCVSCAVTHESLGYYSWIMVGYRVLGYLKHPCYGELTLDSVTVLKCGYWGEKNWSCCLVMDGCMMIGDIVTVV